MKKILIAVLICLFLLTAAQVRAADVYSVTIQVKNPLPFSLTKVLNISVHSKKINSSDRFALFSNGKELPLQILKVSDGSVMFRTLVNLTPNEKKILTLKYGTSINPHYGIIFKPSFSGTYFAGIGSGNLYISSLEDNNRITVKFPGTSYTMPTFTLNKYQHKVVPLKNRNEVFTITSAYPIFAEVSSLKSNCMANSSDDVSSVFGTYFILYIPKEIVVSSYENTNVRIYSFASKKVIYNGTLPPRGMYKNLNLASGFYAISADRPVTIQFGCEDDNVYALNYGSLTEFKGVAYGNIVCSALFPNTTVKIKTADKTFKQITLENSGDFIYKDLIDKFYDYKSEMVPVYVEYSKPVLIYSDSNHGNIGGEQIPSVNGFGRIFVFLTGKIFNFDGVTHKRVVAIIPSYDETHITLNGKAYTLQKAFVPKYFYFDKSYSPVKINSDKAISVFEIGMRTDLECLTMLIPLKSNEVQANVAYAANPSQKPSVPSSNTPSSGKNFLTFLAPLGGMLKNGWNSLENTPWFKNISDTLSEFTKSITPYLKNLSKQIVSLFMPAAAMIYPYIHTYIPSLTQSELAAILFYLLIAFIIILLWPKKRKERNIPVVKVKEEELKKKKVAFNVRTIEEKGPSGIKFGAKGAPKTLSPSAKLKVKKAETPKKEAKPYPTETPKYPFAAKKSEEVPAKNVLSAKGRKTISAPSKGTFETEKEKKVTAVPSEEKKRALSVRNVPMEKEKIEEQKETVEKVKEEPKQAHKNILSAILHHKEAVEKETEESKEKVKPSKEIQKAEGIRKEEVAKSEEQKGVLSEFLNKKEQPEVKEGLAGQKEEKVSEEVVKEPKEKKEKPEEKKKSHGFLSALFHGKEKSEVLQQHKESEEKPTEAKTEEKTSETKTEEKVPKAKEEEKVKTTPKTSLDELLERVKNEMKSKTTENKPPLKTPTVKEKKEAPASELEKGKEAIEEEEPEEIGVKLEASVVMDKYSAEKIANTDIIKRLSRTFVSAKDNPDIDSEKRAKYRIGIIALTPIEMRIAEDLARRIGAKNSTGEMLLIAKKVGVKQIIVNDTPKITNYQGIRITNIKEVIKE